MEKTVKTRAISIRPLWFIALLLTAVTAASIPTSSADAQRNRGREEEEDNSNRTFSPRVGELVAEGQELLNAGDNVGAMRKYDEGLATRGVSPYETGVILILRGTLQYEMDRVPAAIQEWVRAIREGDLAARQI